MMYKSNSSPILLFGTQKVLNCVSTLKKYKKENINIFMEYKRKIQTGNWV